MNNTTTYIIQQCHNLTWWKSFVRYMVVGIICIMFLKISNYDTVLCIVFWIVIALLMLNMSCNYFIYQKTKWPKQTMNVMVDIEILQIIPSTLYRHIFYRYSRIKSFSNFCSCLSNYCKWWNRHRKHTSLIPAWLNPVIPVVISSYIGQKKCAFDVFSFIYNIAD